MKNTIKVILVITLFLSATTISFAGEQGNGTKYCENCATSVIGSDLSGSTNGQTEIDDKLVSANLNDETKDSSINRLFFVLEDLVMNFWM
jgi:hypothetical protein